MTRGRQLESIATLKFTVDGGSPEEVQNVILNPESNDAIERLSPSQEPRVKHDCKRRSMLTLHLQGIHGQLMRNSSQTSRRLTIFIPERNASHGQI
jgi:hypothetical protein